jgi:hypothetical protein
MEEAPDVVFVVMRDAKIGGAYRGVRKAGVEGQWELGRAKRRHGPGRERNRRRSALQVWPLVMKEGSRSRLMACWFLG